VNAFEMGLKGTSRGLRYGIAGFWSDFKDLQVQTIVNALVRTSNAAAARSRGVEAEVNWTASRNFTLFSNFTYLDSVYTSGTLSQGITVPAKGLRLMRSPELSFNLGATIGLELGSKGKVEFSPTFHAESSTELSPINRADFHQEGYTTTNLRARYVPTSEKWSFSIIGENLTNTRLIRRVWDPLNLGASKNFNPDGAMVRGEFEVQF
jgi:iron complex outermembrane receptor protein